MAANVTIRLASRAYDGVLPILRGQIGMPGFDFAVNETEDVPGMFAGMFKGQFDVSEMSRGELIYYTSRGKADFIAIPVFPSRQLFQLYSEAKRWAQGWRRAIPSLVEAWPNHYLTEEQRLFQSDPWAYGLAANRHGLDKFFAYCHAQGISGRTIAPEEIFHTSTHALNEKYSQLVERGSHDDRGGEPN